MWICVSEVQKINVIFYIDAKRNDHLYIQWLWGQQTINRRQSLVFATNYQSLNTSNLCIYIYQKQKEDIFRYKEKVCSFTACNKIHNFLCNNYKMKLNS